MLRTVWYGGNQHAFRAATGFATHHQYEHAVVSSAACFICGFEASFLPHRDLGGAEDNDPLLLDEWVGPYPLTGARNAQTTNSRKGIYRRCHSRIGDPR